MFSTPAPCVSTSVTGTSRAVNWSASFNVFTGSAGLVCRSSAAAAATAGDAMLDPTT